MDGLGTHREHGTLHRPPSMTVCAVHYHTEYSTGCCWMCAMELLHCLVLGAALLLLSDVRAACCDQL